MQGEVVDAEADWCDLQILSAELLIVCCPHFRGRWGIVVLYVSLILAWIPGFRDRGDATEVGTKSPGQR